MAALEAERAHMQVVAWTEVAALADALEGVEDADMDG